MSLQVCVDAEEQVVATPRRRQDARWLTAAFVIVLGVVVATTVAVEQMSLARSCLTGVAAAVVWTVLSARSRPTRRVVSLHAAGFLFILLSIGWDVAGIGLKPLHALVAVVAATVLTCLVGALASGRGVERVLVVGSGYAASAVVVALVRVVDLADEHVS